MLQSLLASKDIFINKESTENSELGTIEYPFHSLNNAFN